MYSNETIETNQLRDLMNSVYRMLSDEDVMTDDIMSRIFRATSIHDLDDICRDCGYALELSGYVRVQ